MLSIQIGDLPSVQQHQIVHLFKPYVSLINAVQLLDSLEQIYFSSSILLLFPVSKVICQRTFSNQEFHETPRIEINLQCWSAASVHTMQRRNTTRNFPFFHPLFKVLFGVYVLVFWDVDTLEQTHRTRTHVRRVKKKIT